MAPGSYLAVPHVTGDQVPEETVLNARAVYARATGRVFPRWAAAIRGFFDGLEIIGPGVVDVRAWRAEPPVREPGRILLFAGVARKP